MRIACIIEDSEPKVTAPELDSAAIKITIINHRTTSGHNRRDCIGEQYNFNAYIQELVMDTVLRYGSITIKFDGNYFELTWSQLFATLSPMEGYKKIFLNTWLVKVIWNYSIYNYVDYACCISIAIEIALTAMLALVHI